MIARSRGHVTGGAGADTSSEGIERARERYALGAHPVARAFEFESLGSDFGANGYATRSEADWLA